MIQRKKTLDEPKKRPRRRWAWMTDEEYEQFEEAIAKASYENRDEESASLYNEVQDKPKKENKCF